MTAKLSVEEILAHLGTQMGTTSRERSITQRGRPFTASRRGSIPPSTRRSSVTTRPSRATAGTAVEIAVRTGMKSSVRDLPPGRTVRRSNLVARLVAELPEGEIFQPFTLAAEVNLTKPRQVQATRTHPPNKRSSSLPSLRGLHT